MRIMFLVQNRFRLITKDEGNTTLFVRIDSYFDELTNSIVKLQDEKALFAKAVITVVNSIKMSATELNLFFHPNVTEKLSFNGIPSPELMVQRIKGEDRCCTALHTKVSEHYNEVVIRPAASECTARLVVKDLCVPNVRIGITTVNVFDVKAVRIKVGRSFIRLGSEARFEFKLFDTSNRELPKEYLKYLKLELAFFDEAGSRLAPDKSPFALASSLNTEGETGTDRLEKSYVEQFSFALAAVEVGKASMRMTVKTFSGRSIESNVLPLVSYQAYSSPTPVIAKHLGVPFTVVVEGGLFHQSIANRIEFSEQQLLLASETVSIENQTMALVFIGKKEGIAPVNITFIDKASNELYGSVSLTITVTMFKKLAIKTKGLPLVKHVGQQMKFALEAAESGSDEGHGENELNMVLAALSLRVSWKVKPEIFSFQSNSTSLTQQQVQAVALTAGTATVTASLVPSASSLSYQTYLGRYQRLSTSVQLTVKPKLSVISADKVSVIHRQQFAIHTNLPEQQLFVSGHCSEGADVAHCIEAQQDSGAGSVLSANSSPFTTDQRGLLKFGALDKDCVCRLIVSLGRDISDDCLVSVSIGKAKVLEILPTKKPVVLENEPYFFNLAFVNERGDFLSFATQTVTFETEVISGWKENATTWQVEKEANNKVVSRRALREQQFPQQYRQQAVKQEHLQQYYQQQNQQPFPTIGFKSPREGEYIVAVRCKLDGESYRDEIAISVTLQSAFQVILHTGGRVQLLDLLVALSEKDGYRQHTQWNGSLEWKVEDTSVGALQGRAGELHGRKEGSTGVLVLKQSKLVAQIQVVVCKIAEITASVKEEPITTGTLYAVDFTYADKSGKVLSTQQHVLQNVRLQCELPDAAQRWATIEASSPNACIIKTRSEFNGNSAPPATLEYRVTVADSGSTYSVTRVFSVGYTVPFSVSTSTVEFSKEKHSALVQVLYCSDALDVTSSSTLISVSKVERKHINLSDGHVGICEFYVSYDGAEFTNDEFVSIHDGHSKQQFNVRITFKKANILCIMFSFIHILFYFIILFYYFIISCFIILF